MSSHKPCASLSEHPCFKAFLYKIDAIKQSDRSFFLNNSWKLVACFVDIDGCYKTAEPNEARWDYLLILFRSSTFHSCFIEIHPKKKTDTLAEAVDEICKKAKWLLSKADDFPSDLPYPDTKLWKKLWWIGRGYPELNELHIAVNSRYARQLMVNHVVYRPSIDLNEFFA